MGTFDIPIAQVDESTLDRLVADERSEGRQLEYKEQLPGDKPEDKREFVADITAFANAIGGDVIYGIRERRDAEGKHTGEPDAVVGLNGVNLETARSRLQNLLRDSVEPRIAGVEFHGIARQRGDPCLLVRVPKSWAAPHMVSYRGSGRFYGRSTSGKYPLDVGEIRSAFLAAEAAQDRVRRLRIERVMRILAQETPIPVGSGPKVILHALPTSPSESPWVQLKTLQDSEVADLMPPLGGRARAWRFNLDGFITYTGSSGAESDSYAQVFRNGGVESMAGNLIFINERDKTFYGPRLEAKLIQNLGAWQKLWKRIGVGPPIAIGVAVFGVKGTGIRPTSDPWVFPHETYPFDRDPIMVPEVVVEDTITPPDVTLKPVLDMLWNAGGWAGSPSYLDGKWTER
jgi:hypothetical protein